MASLPVTGILLAGGQSSRMGSDKAWLEFEGKPIIEHVINRVRPLCSELYIVANDRVAYEPLGLPIISDVFPGKGPLGGLYSGLLAAPRHHCLAVACDMPFLNVSLIEYMMSLAPSYDVVIPRAKDPSGRTPHTLVPGKGFFEKNPRFRNLPSAKQRDLHPMHAVYSKECLASIKRHMEEGDLRLIAFIQDLNIRIVEQSEVDKYDPAHLSFYNVNTPDDLAKALSLAGDVPKDV